MLEQMKQAVFAANRLLKDSGLVVLTGMRLYGNIAKHAGAVYGRLCYKKDLTGLVKSFCCEACGTGMVSCPQSCGRHG